MSDAPKGIVQLSLGVRSPLTALNNHSHERVLGSPAPCTRRHVRCSFNLLKLHSPSHTLFQHSLMRVPINDNA